MAFCEHCLREEPRAVYDLYPSELTALIVGFFGIIIGIPAATFWGIKELVEALAGYMG